MAAGRLFLWITPPLSGCLPCFIPVSGPPAAAHACEGADRGHALSSDQIMNDKPDGGVGNVMVPAAQHGRERATRRLRLVCPEEDRAAEFCWRLRGSRMSVIARKSAYVTLSGWALPTIGHVVEIACPAALPIVSSEAGNARGVEGGQ